jgi:pilus assembly protein CpaE
MAHDWLRILALVKSPTMQRQLTEALGERAGGGLEVRLGELAELASGLLQSGATDLLLLEIDAESPADLDALNRLTVEAGAKGMPVLVTAPNLGTAAMRRLLRDGVTDFIPQPMAAQDVADALATAARRLSAREGSTARGRLLAFSRASGGTGATTLAVNAAWLLAQPQRKQPQAKVCLIDLDLQFGAAALHLDLKPQAGLLEMAKAPERLDAALFQGSLAAHPSGLRALTAPPLPMPLEAMGPAVVSRLLELARAEFDYVVVDLPLALTGWTDTVLSAADLVFLVTRPDVPAVRQLRRMLEVFQDEGLYSLPLRLVLNRELGGFGWGGAGIRRRQVESALGKAIDFGLPDEPEVVSEALNRGRPIFEVKRRSGVGKRLRVMIERATAELAARPAGALPAAA